MFSCRLIVFQYYLHPPQVKSCFFNYIPTSEIISTFKSLKKKSSSGPDIFNNNVVLMAVELLADPLCYIYNLSINAGIFPDKLKIAKVIPIFKKGDKSEISNYRPISLLSVFSKVFEKIVVKRIISFLSKYAIISDNQFGFRPNHSTTTALLSTIIDEIYNSIDDNNFVLGIFFDISKAFDCVNHKILLAKLFHYGIRGQLNKWFESYLHNRSQYTSVNGASSSLDSISCGVPQGSVLGPLLFIIFINDIALLKPIKSLIKMFADDTNLFITGNNLVNIEQKANVAVNLISQWMLANKLALNIDKTYFMLFQPKSKNNLVITLNINLNGIILKQVHSAKFLGVIIDDRLEWKDHIQ